MCDERCNVLLFVYTFNCLHGRHTCDERRWHRHHNPLDPIRRGRWEIFAHNLCFHFHFRILCRAMRLSVWVSEMQKPFRQMNGIINSVFLRRPCEMVKTMRTPMSAEKSKFRKRRQKHREQKWKSKNGNEDGSWGRDINEWVIIEAYDHHGCVWIHFLWLHSHSSQSQFTIQFRRCIRAHCTNVSWCRWRALALHHLRTNKYKSLDLIS